MTQSMLPLKHYQPDSGLFPEKIDGVGLRCEDQMVTIRFTAGEAVWGQAGRQILMDRRLAEELSRLLHNELEDYA